MSGPIIRAGHYVPGAAAGLAVVDAGTQRAFSSDTRAGTETVIWYRIGARVGRNTGSPAIYRHGMMDTTTGQKPDGSSGRVPNNRLAQTVEGTTNVAYTGGGEGETKFLNLETPFASSERNFAFAAACRSGVLTQGMTPAGSLGGSHNTGFYDRNIPAGSSAIQNGYTSLSNQGHEAIWAEGEANVAPNTPGAVTRSGTANRPTMTSTFSDPNETLTNGVAYDELTAHRHTVSWGGSQRWTATYSANATEKSQARSIRQIGVTVPYDTTITYTVEHRDKLGLWSAERTLTFSVPNPNAAPTAPTGLTPNGNVTGTLTPTLSLIHNDPDGDASSRVYVQVQTADGASTMWSEEIPFRAANGARGNIGYNGSTLAYGGIGYRWRARTRDTNGVQGPWSAWANFTLLSGPAVEQPSTPSGRVTDPDNLGSINAIYRNAGGVSANRVRVGVFSASGALISQRELPTSVAPNGTLATSFNAQWGGTGFPFQHGVDYQYAVAARDTNGMWSDWSPFQQLHINAIPNTPTLYAPRDGNVASALPGTIATATDDDNPSSELTVTAEYYNADADALLGSVTLTNIPGTTSHKHIPSDVISGYGNYKWRARSTDGFKTSAWSPFWYFAWQPVPAVTVTSPTGPTITTSQPVFEWESTGQTAWRLQGYDGEHLVFDTGVRPGSIQSYALPPDQYWRDGERWNNLESFGWVLSVQDSSTLWGSSDTLQLTLEYIPPDPLSDVSAESLSLPNVNGTHYVALQYGQSTYTEGEFIQYEADRVEIDGPGGNEVPGTFRVNHLVVSNPIVTGMLDFDVTSKQWYRWAVRQKIQAGLDVIESEPVYVEAMVSWFGTLLHMPFDPLNNYVWLQYGSVGGRYEPVREHGMVVTSETDINGHVHNYIAGMPSVNPSGAYTFLGKNAATAMQQLDALYRMFVYQNPKFSPDGRPHGLCWREGRGGLSGRQYVMLANWVDTGTMGGTQSVELQFIPNLNGGAS